MSKYINNIWKLEFAEKALKQMHKLDKPAQKLVLNYFQKNIISLKNPRTKGKALSGNLSGHWRYRIGDFRALVKIYDSEFIILAVSIGHRREVYSKG